MRRFGRVARERRTRAGIDEFIHLRRAGGWVLRIHTANGPGQDHLQCKLCQRTDDRVLAEFADNDILTGNGVPRIFHIIVADVDAPLLQNRFEPGGLSDGGVIEERQEPPALREVLINFMQFKAGQGLVGAAMISRLQSSGMVLSPSNSRLVTAM